MRDLIGIEDFSKEEIDELIEISKDIMDNKEKYSEMCKGKILATLFFEPSTRTRLSFESAMLSLGGSILGFSNANSSSTSKGESLADTITVVSGYSDIIAMRHPKEGAPLVASMHSNVPIINAGDGGHNHPTQTLLDLLTISKEKGHIDNLTVGLCGDLKYGRTVHSLVTALSLYSNVKFVFISPEELKMPEYINEILDKKNIEYVETNNLEGSIPELDILYMTRIQRERFTDVEEYERLKDVYILDKKKLDNAKEDLSILHPLPRVNEIAVEVDDDKRRAAYFRQAENGRYMRMAIILKLLDEKNLNYEYKHLNDAIESNNCKCENSMCITSIERGLKQLAVKCNDNKLRCIFCDHEIK
ncbi:MAG: aspartate carbamoyltransferase [Clostridia bacterium]|nr:aspartate carbamoyltransferase [Clostridia bacterium]